MFKVNEIFESIQGEGLRIGTLNIFIRFSGCNRNCSFCDTNHENYSEMSIDDIIREVNKFKSHNIILTGGEPTIQDNLKELVMRLKEEDYYVAMESNGSGSKSIYSIIDWLSISPKDILPKTINNLRYAKEVKVVVNYTTKQSDITNLQVDHKIALILQPESNLKESFIQCQEIQKQLSRARIIPQVHKLTGWR